MSGKSAEVTERPTENLAEPTPGRIISARLVQRAKTLLVRRPWTKISDRFLVPLLSPKDANLLQCSEPDLWNKYFSCAEAAMQAQWDDIIWPLIKGFDFDAVLELAPGAGRNTERLCEVAKKIFAVDYNSYALDQCRERLGISLCGCDIEYHVNSGTDLSMIEDQAVSAVYCWDAAVHFDKSILECYVREFARVLRPGGRGFVHHSNLGKKANKNIKKNPHWRSNMSKESFARICSANGLQVVNQVDIPWGNHVVDCGSIFEK